MSSLPPSLVTEPGYYLALRPIPAGTPPQVGPLTADPNVAPNATAVMAAILDALNSGVNAATMVTHTDALPLDTAGFGKASNALISLTANRTFTVGANPTEGGAYEGTVQSDGTARSIVFPAGAVQRGTDVIPSTNLFLTKLVFEYTNNILLYAIVPLGIAPPALPTAPALPNAPTGLVVSGITDTTATLAWTAPVAGGTVDDYVIEMSPAGAGTWAVFTDGVSAKPGAALSNAPALQNTDVRVKSRNAAGDSAYCDIVTFAFTGAIALTFVRFGVIGGSCDETGTAGTGWLYHGNNAGSDGNNENGGNANLSAPPTGDWSVSFKLPNDAPHYGPSNVVYVKDQATAGLFYSGTYTQAFGLTFAGAVGNAYALWDQNGNDANPDTALTSAPGDICKIERIGADMVLSIARAALPTKFARMKTWVGRAINNRMYPGFNSSEVVGNVVGPITFVNLS